MRMEFTDDLCKGQRVPPANLVAGFKSTRRQRYKHKRGTKARPALARTAKTAATVPSVPAARSRARNSALTADLADVPVLIDYRAGSVGLLSYPPFDVCGVRCNIKNARGEPAGDVCFVGNGAGGKVMVGIELKSLDDLLSSLLNGRLQGTQLPVMVDEYDSVWLVYYGQYRPAPRTHCLQTFERGAWRNKYAGTRPIPYGYLKGFIIGLQEIGVNVMPCADMSEAAATIAEIVRWRSKAWTKHKSLRAFDRSRKITTGQVGRAKQVNRAALMPTFDDRTKYRANVALQFPALGYERALVAADRWTVEQMIAATADDWARLATIDKATGKTKKFGKSVGDAIVRANKW